jgi:hypothetical protein
MLRSVNVERFNLPTITEGGFGMKTNNSPEASKKPLLGKDGKPVPTANGAKPSLGKETQPKTKA